MHVPVTFGLEKVKKNPPKTQINKQKKPLLSHLLDFFPLLAL